MLVSMTGFGSSSYEDSNLSINIELKSFNSRYFELNTKSFDLSGPLEYKIRNYLKKQLFRGSVSLIVKVWIVLESPMYRNLRKNVFTRKTHVRMIFA